MWQLAIGGHNAFSIPGDANGIYLHYLASKQQKRPLVDLLMVKKFAIVLQYHHGTITMF